MRLPVQITLHCLVYHCVFLNEFSNTEQLVSQTWPLWASKKFFFSFFLTKHFLNRFISIIIIYLFIFFVGFSSLAYDCNKYFQNQSAFNKMIFSSSNSPFWGIDVGSRKFFPSKITCDISSFKPIARNGCVECFFIGQKSLSTEKKNIDSERLWKILFKK